MFQILCQKNLLYQEYLLLDVLELHHQPFDLLKEYRKLLEEELELQEDLWDLFDLEYLLRLWRLFCLWLPLHQ
jgi:hypothetical protein